MEDLQHRLGQRIRRIRSKLGYTQESFADACGLHRNYMGAIERGEQNITIKTLQIIARGLDTSVSKLFAGLD
jgi:transcriptional regulator with XRE-family HTH domain